MDSWKIVWVILFEHFFGHYTSYENERAFRSETGVHPEVAECIFSRYGDPVALTRKTLLIVLHYLKHYPTEDCGSRIFKFKCRATYRNHLWNAIDYLDNAMGEIYLGRRFEGFIPTHGLFANIALVVDGTDCPIQRPNSPSLYNYPDRQRWLRNLYTTGRKKENSKSKYVFKYTVAVQVSTGIICFVSGPDPGSMHDKKALDNSELIRLVSSEDPDEIILADKGYSDARLGAVITPIKRKPCSPPLSPEEEAFNMVISSVRFIVEDTLGRMQIFGILRVPWRNGCENHEQHRKIFNVVAQITNISVTREPLRLERNFFLY